MKSYHKAFLTALSTFTLTTGCQLDELVPAEDNNTVDDIVFYVGHENNADTKTALANDGFKVNFQSGDAINVFDGTNNIKFSTTSTGADATFEKASGSGPAESENYYAHYPYNSSVTLSGGKIVTSIPSVQNAPKGSFDPAANVSVAKAAKIGVQDLGGGIKQAQYRLTFLNVGNLVKFHFNEDSNVSAIVIRCNANQNLTGKIKVNPVTGEYDRDDISEGSTSITLKPSESDYFLEGDYYAVMLPLVHKKGISVKMEHDEGSYHFKRGGVTDLEMKRNKIYQLYSGDITQYTEAAVLPSLYLQNGNNPTNYTKLNTASRISFHAMAQDVDWNYADANNQLHIMPGSDVRGYIHTDGTLHIYTKKGMFSIPEKDVNSDVGDGAHMFEGYSNVTAIDNLSYIDVTFLHSFKNMFYGCKSLTTIDISGWDTSSATDMTNMFRTAVTSSLRDIILGEFFVLCSDHSNIFGDEAQNRTNRIRVSSPETVYEQFSTNTYDTEPIAQVTWNHGSDATKFGEFLNPTIMATSVNHTVNFTFTIGGNHDTSEIGDITVGFDGYTPTSPQFTHIGNETIDGVDYVMYTLTLTSAQKNDRRVITEVTAQATEKNPTHVIMSSEGFTVAKFESRIYPFAFSGDVQVAPNDGDNASTNLISGLTANDWKDYSGHNWPIAGQSCNVTFYLKITDGMSIDAVKLSNGTTSYSCTASGSGAPAGYTAYTANNVLVSNTSEVKNLKVLVQVEGQRMLHEAGSVPVKVYGITLGAGITTASAFTVNTTDVYVIKSNTSGRFLFTDGNKTTSYIKTKAADTPDNLCFWKFNPASSPVQLLTYNTSTQRYISANFQAIDLTGGNKAVSLTISDGLKFANGTKYMREATVNSSNPTTVSLATTADQNEWTVFPVTFTAP